MRICTVGVVGAGTMGNGIAQAFAVSGFNVTLVDITVDAAQRGRSLIQARLQRLADNGKLADLEWDSALERIKCGVSYELFHDADLVIEAASERLELKLSILRKIEPVVNATTIIASNTSSISITELASSLKDPSRLIGMHFFNPVQAMQLVEIIRGLQTSDETVEAVLQVANSLGKTPIMAKNSPGFVVNRVVIPMINEAIFLVAEGVASPQEIDSGMRLGANHPIGPLALADLIGLDVCLSVMEVLQRDIGDQKYRPCPLLRELVAAGRLGRKTKRGIFSYD
jgi:3-hydroxybutyryl-CoA dehydrogenase